MSAMQEQWPTNQKAQEVLLIAELIVPESQVMATHRKWPDKTVECCVFLNKPLWHWM